MKILIKSILLYLALTPIAYSDEAGDVGVSVSAFACNDDSLDAATITYDTLTEIGTTGRYTYSETASVVNFTESRPSCSSPYELKWSLSAKKAAVTVTNCTVVNQGHFDFSSNGSESLAKPDIQDNNAPGDCEGVDTLDYTIQIDGSTW